MCYQFNSLPSIAAHIIIIIIGKEEEKDGEREEVLVGAAAGPTSDYCLIRTVNLIGERLFDDKDDDGYKEYSVCCGCGLGKARNMLKIVIWMLNLNGRK